MTPIARFVGIPAATSHPVSCICTSEDGRWLASGSSLGNIVIWSLLDNQRRLLLCPFSILEGHESALVAICDARLRSQAVIASGACVCAFVDRFNCFFVILC